MGASTNGQICYGIVFEEDHEFPWDAEPFNGDLNQWWLKQIGFVPKNNSYEEECAALLKHPVPIALVNYCSDTCPMYMVAIPASCTSALRGYPERITQDTLNLPCNWAQELVAFCDRFDLHYSEGPGWYLSSYWSS